MDSGSRDKSFQEAIERRRRRSERLRLLAEEQGATSEGGGKGGAAPEEEVPGDWVIPADDGLDVPPREDEAASGDAASHVAGGDAASHVASGEESDGLPAAGAMPEVEAEGAPALGEEQLAAEVDLAEGGEDLDAGPVASLEVEDEEAEAVRPAEREAGAEVADEEESAAEAAGGLEQEDPLAEASRVVEEAVQDVTSEEWMEQSGQIESTEDEIEEDVERLGQVIDLEAMPKTEPKRVLSKTRAKEEGREDAVGPAPKRSGKVGKASEDTSRGKRRRVSLLDSYFKGL